MIHQKTKYMYSWEEFTKSTRISKEWTIHINKDIGFGNKTYRVIVHKTDFTFEVIQNNFFIVKENLTLNESIKLKKLLIKKWGFIDSYKKYEMKG